MATRERAHPRMDPPDPQKALRQVADERAALRRVAELVARGATRDEVLHAVAAQASGLTGVEFVTLLRFEPDGTSARSWRRWPRARRTSAWRRRS